MALTSKDRPCTWRRAVSTLCVGAVACSSLVALSALPAFAGASSEAPPAALSTIGPPPGSEEAARAAARASGVPQPVDDLTTPTSQTIANPDGTFTLEQSVLPTRVDQNGSWVPVDLTLEVGADGVVRPKAGPSDLAFSGGGTGPLVTTTGDDGSPLSISYPANLPTPTLAGAAATYANVMPGVDLVVTATDGGGFSEVFSVKTPTAGSNPDLADIDLTVAAPGLNIAADPVTGALHGTSSGDLGFTAPTPIMWDSTAARTPGGPGVDPSDGSAPGEHALTAEVDADPGSKTTAGGITRQTLTVRPDLGMLTDPDTIYPVFIDPYFSTTKGRLNFTWVQAGCPTTMNFNSQARDPGVGYNGYSGCVGIERTYYQLDTASLNDAYVSTATLKTSVTYSAKFCPAGAYAVKATYTSAFNENTSWNNRPGAIPAPDDDSDTVNVTHCQGQSPVNVNFDVTKSIKRAANNGYASNTYALSGNETDQEGFKRFGDNPTLTVTYDRTPNAPTGLTLTPAPVNGWIGATNAVTDVIAAATVSSPLSGQTVSARFTMTDTDTGSKILNAAPSDETVTTSGTVHRDVPALTNGHDYTWSAYTSDGILSSASTNGTGFGVDLTPPTMTSIASTDYPPSGSSTQTTKHAGAPGVETTGTFSLTATDDHSGVARIDWLLAPLPTGSAPAQTSTGGSKTFTGGPASASASTTLTPPTWGTTILFARVIDRAGNTSQTKQYVFYVPPNPDATPTLGDIDGDHTPDILTVTTDGALRSYPAKKDPVVVNPTNSVPANGPYIASPANQGPGGSWTGAIVTHRGSFTGSRIVDDLFVWKNNVMALYANDGGGHFYRLTGADVDHFRCQSNCTGYPSDWSQLTSMVGPGILTHTDPTDPPDLLTIEDGRIWLYPGCYCQGVQQAMGLSLVGPGGASLDATHSDLVAPGDVNQDGKPDLWVRNRTTGSVTQFLGTTSSPWLTTTGTSVGAGYTADAAPIIYSGGDLLHDTRVTTNYAPSLVSLTGAGTLQLRETLASPAREIAPSSFAPTATTVENQFVRQTRNVYVPVAPSRLLDTRVGSGGTINPGVKHSWPIVGLAGVPSSGVTAVNVNVIGIGTSTNDSWIRFGDNGPAAATSTLDTIGTQPVSSSEIVVPDAQGNISAYVGGGGAADVVIDVVGYYTDKSDADAASVTGSYAVPMTITRVCDSRSGSNAAPGCGTVPTTGNRTVTIAGYGGVPANATAVIADFILVGAPTATSVVAWPSNLSRPGITSIYGVAGQNTSSTSTVQLSPSGQLSLYSSAGTQNIIIDVQGYYVPTTTGTAPPGATTYIPVPPTRAFYSDDPAMSGTSATPLASGATRSISITGTRDTLGKAIIPPTGACAVAIHIAALKGTTPGHLVLTPQGVTTTAGTINYPAVKARENFVVLKLSANGVVDVYNGGGNPTDYYIDIVGYLTPVSGAC